MKAHFQTLAAYNAWANRRLYAAAAALPDADYRADLGAFFKSVHGTLNHLLVADSIWMARFRDRPNPKVKLNTILHEDREALAAARAEMDAEIIAYVDSLTDADIARSFSYTPMTSPDPVTEPLAPALTHFFNHQTHHRGQVHALLTRLTGDAPPLDLIYFLREAA